MKKFKILTSYTDTTPVIASNSSIINQFKIPTQENPIPYKFPLRVGRKQGRAMLDADGIEIVIFPKGAETMAKITCEMWNATYTEIMSTLITDENEIDPEIKQVIDKNFWDMI